MINSRSCILIGLLALALAPATQLQSQPKETSMKTEKAGPIPGYRFGDPALKTSPLTLDDLALLKKTLLWSESDDRALARTAEVLEDQVDDILDTWYGYVGGNEHLVAYFSNAQGQPDGEYLQAVRKRFGQWILDVCRRPHDQAWLDWQYEIALRHTRAKKNRTDQADAVDHIPLRYMTAFIYPITATMKPFLAAKGHSPEEVEAMYQAWFKSVVLHVTVWSHPYAQKGDF